MELREATLDGMPLRDGLRSILAVDDVENRGAIHVLSDERLDRYELTLYAVRMALVSGAHR